MEKQSSLLGVFDSGVGGFSVLQSIHNTTSVDTLYFGDCANAPYGNRPLEEIIYFIKNIIQDLQTKNVTHFVSACNSMSVLTTDILLEELGIPHTRYTDMIRAFKRHQTIPKGSSVLVIGTKATIESRAYQQYLEAFGYTVFEYTPHTLARAIEESVTGEALSAIIDPIIAYGNAVGASYIIFGCTHYPLARAVFEGSKKKYSWKGEFIDPGVYVAHEVALWGVTGDRKHTYLTSKTTKAFLTHKPNEERIHGTFDKIN
jgi:glutamate racemase